MALSRRGGQRMTGSIWPGFVDAMTALLMVLMFVLSIFMIVQSVLREQISEKDSEISDMSNQINDQNTELDALTRQLGALAEALGAEQRTSAALRGALEVAQGDIDMQSTLIATLTERLTDREGALEAAEGRIADFEAQVLALIAERDAARGEAGDLRASLAEVEAARDAALGAEDAARLALARARDQIDAAAEVARLDAARREALEALLAQLRAENAEGAEALAAEQARRAADLEAAEAARLADAAAAEALRARLAKADAELTAMTLALEDRRREAEETLTLLAAAEAAREGLQARLAAALAEGGEAEDALADLRARLLAAQAAQADAETARVAALSEAEVRARLLAQAQRELAGARAASTEDQRRLALLNAQVADLQTQLQRLDGLLDAAEARDGAAKVQIDTLGARLNAALAQVAAEQRKSARLEAAEAARLAEEARRLAEDARRLERYRSDFFGKLREVLADREGVRVVGDRFVFSSEVLFSPGEALLSAEGAAQIDRVASTLRAVADEIPPEIDWILRVDGHTDATPLSGGGAFADNWELSQARALSVVRFLQDELGFPPQRLAAAGFGQYRPVAQGTDPEALAQNRRIELKLTER